MARINVYIPDELAERAKEANLNISRATRDALSAALAVEETNRWLDHRIALLPGSEASHEEVLAALEAARDEFGA